MDVSSKYFRAIWDNLSPLLSLFSIICDWIISIDDYIQGLAVELLKIPAWNWLWSMIWPFWRFRLRLHGGGATGGNSIICADFTSGTDSTILLNNQQKLNGEVLLGFSNTDLLAVSFYQVCTNKSWDLIWMNIHWCRLHLWNWLQ